MGLQTTILTALTTLFLFSGSAVSQISYASCTNSTYSWTYNSLNQNPCEVAAYMEGTCNQGVFSVDPLLPGNEYFGPNGVDDSNLCKCSTVAYSLVSACGACQGEDWITWSEWVTNCTKIFPASNFPNPVPDGTGVPQWALLDVTLENSWDPTKSFSTGDTPEIPPGALIGSSSTRTPGPTGSTSPNPTASPTSKGKSSNTGAIVGGIVAGIAVIAVSAFGFFYLRRRRPGPEYAAPSSTFAADHAPFVFDESQPRSGSIEGPSDDGTHASSSIPASPMTSMRVYNPNDPTTFPTFQAASYKPNTSPRTSYGPQQGTGNTLATMQVTRPQGYRGLPIL